MSGRVQPAEGQRAAHVLLVATALILLAAVAHRTWHHGFVSDFWEHAASVRALAERPLAPHHPMLDLAAPHEFLSPYALLLGLVVRLSGASAVTVLELAALANLVLFLAALSFFVRRLAPGNPWAPVAALLCILFLWGEKAWFWSGFFHLAVLPLVAPYPSTVAAALVFLVLGFQLGAGNAPPSAGRLAAVALVFALVLLIHAITAVVLACGLMACWLHGTRVRPATVVRDAAGLGTALAAGAILALSWPYYPLGDLLFGTQGAAFHAANAGFARHVFARTWPAWLGIPALVVRVARDRRDPLVWWELGLVGAFGVGTWSGHDAAGRVVSFAVMVPQIALGVLIGEWLARWSTPVRAWALTASCAVLLALAVVPRAWQAERPGYPTAFLAGHVGPDDVVLADPWTGFQVPAVAGKVIASRPPVVWIPDDPVRRRDLARFLAADTSAEERRAILRRYGVRFLLVDKFRPPKGAAALGTLAAETYAYGLYRVDAP